MLAKGCWREAGEALKYADWGMLQGDEMLDHVSWKMVRACGVLDDFM